MGSPGDPDKSCTTDNIFHQWKLHMMSNDRDFRCEDWWWPSQTTDLRDCRENTRVGVPFLFLSLDPRSCGYPCSSAWPWQESKLPMWPNTNFLFSSHEESFTMQMDFALRILEISLHPASCYKPLNVSRLHLSTMSEGRHLGGENRSIAGNGEVAVEQVDLSSKLRSPARQGHGLPAPEGQAIKQLVLTISFLKCCRWTGHFYESESPLKSLRFCRLHHCINERRGISGGNLIGFAQCLLVSDYLHCGWHIYGYSLLFLPWLPLFLLILRGNKIFTCSRSDWTFLKEQHQTVAPWILKHDLRTSGDLRPSWELGSSSFTRFFFFFAVIWRS